ncbi:TPA: AprI/Inh family metalloprotease inhibitor [Serratia odorifera]|nr:AprI/Inh family metalloprotease inhibitor [Serratia sp. AKBS12]HEI8868030.1 AprI/Inh family metalloprotease inhibitor [Serratia odorifera]
MIKRIFRDAMMAGSILMTGVVMASSLVLPSAQSLAGQWQLANGERQCRLELLAEAQHDANGYQLRDRQQCLKGIFNAEAIGWRAAPDGIALLRADGSTLAFFSRDGAVYRHAIGAADGLTLTPLR